MSFFGEIDHMLFELWCHVTAIILTRQYRQYDHYEISVPVILNLTPGGSRG